MPPSETAGLVVLGAFWNDEAMLRRSMKEVEKLNPDLVLLAEGCFDHKKSSESTDATRQIMEEWARSDHRIKVWPVVRRPRWRHFQNDLAQFLNGGFGSGVGSLPLLIRRLTHSLYRLNQAATFNFLLQEAAKQKEIFWFMTYDADEFFDEPALESIRDIRTVGDYDLLTTREVVFWGSQQNLAPWYPTIPFRTWNVPFRFKTGMRFLLTRELYQLDNEGRMKKAWLKARIAFIGATIHLKTDKARILEGLELGDRKKPSSSRTREIRYLSGHRIIDYGD